MNIERWICLGAAIFAGCSAVPTRALDCGSSGRCEPLQFIYGQPDATTNNRLRTGLSGPTSAIIVNKHLVVADTNQHRVLIWTTFPAVNQPPDLVLGQPDLTTGQPNAGGLSARSLASPASLASDGTRLVISDGGNHRVLIWNSFPTVSFAPADVVLGQRDFLTATLATTPSNQTISGSPTSAPTTFPGVYLVQSPKTAGQTMLIVTDSGANRVLFWDPVPATSFTAATGALGQADFVTGTAATTTSGFATPTGSASLDSGELAIADSANHRVVVFAAPPTTGASATAGSVFLGQASGAVGMANQGTAAPTRASLNLPLGVAAVGKMLYVADSRNHRVMLWNDDSTTTGVDAAFVLGQTSFTTATPAVGPAALFDPRSVWSDGSTTVVADTGNHRVMVWNKAITTIGQDADRVIGQPGFGQNQIDTSPSLSATELSLPLGLCSDGVFLTADTNANRVLFWPHIPLLPTDAPTLALGQMDFSTAQPLSGGISASSLSLPTSVTCRNGNIAVADAFNNRVLVWTRPITSMAQPADLVLGQPGAMTGDANHGGTTAGLSGPFAVHLWGGTLYVADTNNNRVLIWDQLPTAGQTQKAPDLVLGQTDFTGVAAGSPSATTLNHPMGLYHDDSRLYVADSGNHRVLVFLEPITTSGQAAAMVIGQGSLTAAGQNGVRSSTLGTPLGVAGAGDRLYIADADNNRVLYFLHLPTQDGQTADGVIGQVDFTSHQPNDGGLSASRLQQPAAILPTSDALYIADSMNGRIVVMPPP